MNGVGTVLLESVWLEEWKSGKMEKWENKKHFIFSHICLVGSGKVEK